MTTTERKALLLDREATILTVSSYRKLLQAANTLLACRYSDGENDAAALSSFAAIVQEVQDDMRGDAGEESSGA